MSSPNRNPNPNPTAPTLLPDPSRQTPSPQQPPPPTLPALTASASFSRGRGGKKKPRALKKKHQQKLDLILSGTRLVPFSPQKTLDFTHHEELLRRLGLWDFLHLDLDRTLRPDLVLELIATYEKGARCASVKGLKIRVGRADLARALGFPGGRWKEGFGGGDGEIDGKGDGAAIGFLLDVVNNWLLLHDDDTWILPKEVSDWLMLLREGLFDKVDWAGVVWFMVEKELSAAPSLGSCYYASHLQCLIRHQRPKLFVEGEKEGDEVEVDDDDVEEVVEEEEDLKTGEVEENNTLELSLGNENTEEFHREDEERGLDLLDSRIDEEEILDKDGDSGGGNGLDRRDGMDDMDIEHGEEEKGYTDGENVADDVMDSGEGKEVAEEKREEQCISGRWLFDGKSDAGVHFLQPCSVGNGLADEDGDEKGMGIEGNVISQEEIVEDEEEDDEDVDEADENEEGLGEFNDLQRFSELERLQSSNFLQVMESEQIPFNPGMQIRDASCGDFADGRPENHVMGSTSSMYGNLGKRGIDQNGDDLLQHSLGGSNKRIRTDDQWDPKYSDFYSCLDQMQHFMDKARMIYASKEQNYADSAMNQQLLMSELQQRDNVIEQLQKLRDEDMLKRQQEVRRLEQELYMMTDLLDGYRKALKETNRTFMEYRAQCPQLDEPLYRDVPGSGGLVLSASEFETLQAKKEEEERIQLMIKDKLKEAEATLDTQFGAHREAINILNSKLLAIEEQFTDIKEFAAKRKLSQTTEASPAKE
ncbi:hypothetical protein MLD38_003106 [Melastoma candidum]|uniref:Uncharacterized protein n=1 Tax=Melastoma candidum TaxID=119954 RepID=A0ACB9S105_9MYRT|nr:hypothetical protein MLD38_003106 [Melastoma candidum]